MSLSDLIKKHGHKNEVEFAEKIGRDGSKWRIIYVWYGKDPQFVEMLAIGAAKPKPTEFKSINNRLAEAGIFSNADDLAAFVGRNKQTIWRWGRDRPQFLECLIAGAEVVKTDPDYEQTNL